MICIYIYIYIIHTNIFWVLFILNFLHRPAVLQFDFETDCTLLHHDTRFFWREAKTPGNQSACHSHYDVARQIIFATLVYYSGSAPGEIWAICLTLFGITDATPAKDWLPQCVSLNIHSCDYSAYWTMLSHYKRVQRHCWGWEIFHHQSSHWAESGCEGDGLAIRAMWTHDDHGTGVS